MHVIRCPFCNHEATSAGKLWGHYGRCSAAQSSPLSRDERRGLMLEAIDDWHEVPDVAPKTSIEAPEQCPYCDYQGTSAQVLGHCGRRHLDKMPRKARNVRLRRSVEIKPPAKVHRGRFEQLLRAYQASAAERGHAWNLSLEQFASLTSRHCTYCGAPPKLSAHRIIHNGVDRADNARGYEFDNCVPCCGRCNLMKGRLSHDDFVAHSRRIVAYADSGPVPIKVGATSIIEIRPIKYRKDTKQQ